MPPSLVSDNGTQFTSKEFKYVCIQNGLHHLTVAPLTPHSNGQAKRFVDTFKRAIRKISTSGCSTQESLDTFLLTYRSTPKSPTKIMLLRTIRTTLDLLRLPTTTTCVLSVAYAESRSFRPSDPVYAKRYFHNGWKRIRKRMVPSSEKLAT